MTKEERAKKAKSMNFTFDDENDGTPIQNSDFLNSADPVKNNFAAPRSFLDFNNKEQLQQRNAFPLLYFKLEKNEKKKIG